MGERVGDGGGGALGPAVSNGRERQQGALSLSLGAGGANKREGGSVFVARSCGLEHAPRRAPCQSRARATALTALARLAQGRPLGDDRGHARARGQTRRSGVSRLLRAGETWLLAPQQAQEGPLVGPGGWRVRTRCGALHCRCRRGCGGATPEERELPRALGLWERERERSLCACAARRLALRVRAL